MNNNSLIVHIPHSSTIIPSYYRKAIKLNDKDLNTELLMLTDLYCDKLFDLGLTHNKIITPVSRLVCDVERFITDDKMENLGMGVLYTRTHDGRRLRENSENIRNEVINQYYTPHHTELSNIVKDCLKKFGCCTILDCHSFDERMHYTGYKRNEMPDVCIGVDDFHTPEHILSKIIHLITKYGYKVGINIPFSGSMVPLNYYNKDENVQSIMIEINRKLYSKDFKIDTVGFNKVQKMCKEIESELIKVELISI